MKRRHEDLLLKVYEEHLILPPCLKVPVIHSTSAWKLRLKRFSPSNHGLVDWKSQLKLACAHLNITVREFTYPIIDQQCANTCNGKIKIALEKRFSSLVACSTCLKPFQKPQPGVADWKTKLNVLSGDFYAFLLLNGGEQNIIIGHCVPSTILKQGSFSKASCVFVFKPWIADLNQ